MPDRFWVGGTGSWDGTAGTKWAATSGGAGGASLPTSADDVFFDAASGASTVTIAAGNIGARSINCTGFTGTITGSTLIAVSGSVTLAAAMTWSHVGTVSFLASGFLTTAGKTFSTVTVNGAGITLTLGDALNISTRVITVNNGNFTTANFNVTAGQLVSNNPATRVINLGSSTVTLSASIPIGFGSTGLTFNAGTSLIDVNHPTPTFNGGGSTFNNVSFTNTTSNLTTTLDNTNTFNNLSFASPSGQGVRQVQLNSRQIVNGVLSNTGGAGNRRIWFRSSTYGIALPLLTINGSTSIADVDFRDVVVTGTAAPISGTRIGDLRGNGGITFSAPKTVFRIGVGNWSDNQWSATSGGSVSTNDFPLAQDTAVINQSTSAGTLTLDSFITYIGTIDMSARTTALTLSQTATPTIYGNWIHGTGVSNLGGSGGLIFSGRNLQTITSAGRDISGINGITIDSFGGTIELADAMNISGKDITITNGSFNTRNFSLSSGGLVLNNTNVKALSLGSSTVTLGTASPLVINATNLTFDAGTSQINLTSSSATFSGAGLTYHNMAFTSIAISNVTITGNNTFNNVTVTSPISTSLSSVTISDNQTINGSLNISGGSSTRRLFVFSGVVGAPRTLSVASLLATDCDFRDIIITGAAAGSSQTRAGDCGGNSGIGFPSPKTVFRVGAFSGWSVNAWATTSGGTPDLNNFPLAQDTFVFDNTTGASIVTFDAAWNIGSFNGSSRTTAITLALSTLSPRVHGNWTLGAGVTTTGTGALVFSGRGTMTITSNGVAFGCPVTINCITGTVQLADAFAQTDVTGNVIALTTGGFNAQTFNVTTRSLNSNVSATNVRRLSMGSGTWTITGVADVWSLGAAQGLEVNPGTANIILSNNTTAARTFLGGHAYNKLTIGGNTSTSTTTIDGNNQFTELASTKTVAHTIALGVTAQTFGAWTVTGTVGNVVTLTGTGTSHVIAGAATSGINYLAMGSIGFGATSPGEFYAGPNSTGTAGAPVFRTAPPAARTLYWVGGTGNWGDTARWSTSSGGAGGAAIPTSLDNVIFNSASNATAYTATLNVVARCNQLTIAGPASGNLTLAGSSRLIIHDNAVFPATGFTRTFTSTMVLSGSTTGKTFTSNGVSFQGIGDDTMQVNGIGAGWSMSDALNLGNNAGLRLINGTFSTNNFALTAAQLLADSGGSRTLNLGSSTVTLAGSSSAIQFGFGQTNRDLFTFNPGTSQININVINASIGTNDLALHNVSFSPASLTTLTVNGSSTYNNLTFGAPPATGLQNIVINGNLTVTGTLTFTAGTNATRRHFCRTTAIGTTHTITCAAFSGTDVDFRDIAVTGAAAPISGTRLGDCKGNSGITFGAGVSKFWNLAGGGSWSSTGWATTGGGTPAVNNFPLAQDTCVFQTTGLNSGGNVSFDASFNVGTIDMSARTTNTMTLGIGTNQPTIHGNWINGTGSTVGGAGGVIIFAGRTAQTITSAGISAILFAPAVTINSPGGSVTLLDAYNSTNQLAITLGTFDAGSFNVAIGNLAASGSGIRTIAIGSGTWSISGTGVTAWNTGTSTNLTVTGSGTINMNSGSAKTFVGGSVNYSGITLNQNGSGDLTISGDNTFRDITATRTTISAATISLGTTTQRLTRFTGKGEATRLLTIQGTSTASPATLIYTGTGPATNNTVDYLSLLGVRAYPLTNTWYAGNNSTNNGTLGWIFEQTPAVLPGNGNFFLMFL